MSIHKKKIGWHIPSTKEGTISKSQWKGSKPADKVRLCANRFYGHIEEQKTAISEYLDKTFGRWYDDIWYDTWLMFDK